MLPIEMASTAPSMKMALCSGVTAIPAGLDGQVTIRTCYSHQTSKFTMLDGDMERLRSAPRSYPQHRANHGGWHRSASNVGDPRALNRLRSDASGDALIERNQIAAQMDQGGGIWTSRRERKGRLHQPRAARLSRRDGAGSMARITLRFENLGSKCGR